MDWIAVWDLETTLPEDGSVDCDIVEFGVLLVDPASLTIKQEYSSLVQSDRVSAASQAVNGIGPDSLRQAPRFSDLAQRIHQLLDGQVWAGHNLEQFDIPVLNRAFQQFKADPPLALKVLDTYRLFGDWLRRRRLGRTRRQNSRRRGKPGQQVFGAGTFAGIADQSDHRAFSVETSPHRDELGWWRFRLLAGSGS